MANIGCYKLLLLALIKLHHNLHLHSTHAPPMEKHSPSDFTAKPFHSTSLNFLIRAWVLRLCVRVSPNTRLTHNNCCWHYRARHPFEAFKQHNNDLLSTTVSIKQQHCRETWKSHTIERNTGGTQRKRARDRKFGKILSASTIKRYACQEQQGKRFLGIEHTKCLQRWSFFLFWGMRHSLKIANIGCSQ